MIDGLGKITAVSKDFVRKSVHVTAEIINVSPDVFQELDPKEQYQIIIKKKGKKRSLDANSYLWVLCSQIAEKMDSSKEEVYENMLHSYGTLYKDDDGYITITVKSIVDMDKIDGHWFKVKDNGTFASYIMIKGSSEYSSSEMAKLLDGVVYEAKQLGIQTETENELAKLKAMWGNANDKKCTG